MTDVSADSRVYRRLLGIGLWRRLTVTSGFQRLSVAMAPIALVLAHSATGSFSVGALMASAYTFADGFASPLSGRLMDRIELRRGVSLEMGAARLPPMALAGLAAIRAPGAALIVVSALAGVAPAGVMGGLRAYLQRIVPADLRERAFALMPPCWSLSGCARPPWSLPSGSSALPSRHRADGAGGVRRARQRAPARPATAVGGGLGGRGVAESEGAADRLRQRRHGLRRGHNQRRARAKVKRLLGDPIVRLALRFGESEQSDIMKVQSLR